MRGIITWTLGLLALLALAGLIFAVTTAHAFPTYVNEITVADFRSLDAGTQTGYVIGFISYSHLMGVGCPLRSMAEYRAAILHNGAKFKDGDKLSDALFNFMVDNGCRATR